MRCTVSKILKVFCFVRCVQLFCNKQTTADAFHTLNYLSFIIILTSNLWKCNVCSWKSFFKLLRIKLKFWDTELCGSSERNFEWKTFIESADIVHFTCICLLYPSSVVDVIGVLISRLRNTLTLIVLMWRIGWAHNNARK